MAASQTSFARGFLRRHTSTRVINLARTIKKKKERDGERKKEAVLNEEQRVHAALTTAISLKLNAA